MGSLVTVPASTTAIAAPFFLKFWRRTNDSFFLLFSAAFAIDAVGRFTLTIGQLSDIAEPVYFLPRLVMFGLIVIAIANKNAPTI